MLKYHTTLLCVNTVREPLTRDISVPVFNNNFVRDRPGKLILLSNIFLTVFLNIFRPPVLVRPEFQSIGTESVRPLVPDLKDRRTDEATTM